MKARGAVPLSRDAHAACTCPTSARTAGLLHNGRETRPPRVGGRAGLSESWQSCRGGQAAGQGSASRLHTGQRTSRPQRSGHGGHGVREQSVGDSPWTALLCSCYRLRHRGPGLPGRARVGAECADAQLGSSRPELSPAQARPPPHRLTLMANQRHYQQRRQQASIAMNTDANLHRT